MPQMWWLQLEDFLDVPPIRMCACDCYADGLYQGKYRHWGMDGAHFRPLNRWLCEQCAQNIREDGGTARRVRRQILTYDQEKVFDLWHERNLEKSYV